MLFLKIMFWITLAGVIIQSIFCCMEHPRRISPFNTGTDIVILIKGIVVAVFFWGYAFGGWTLR